MKGIIVKELGDPDVCKMGTDLLVPEPQENQVILRRNYNVSNF